MRLHINPSRNEWKALLQRPAIDAVALEEKVRLVLNDVQQQGDVALYRYTEMFDDVLLSSLLVSEEEIAEATGLVTDELKQAIEVAITNITAFHRKQVTAPEIIETMPGVQCWRKSVGIEKVGLYIPGGTAPLFSTVLMLAIPAKLAGCKEIILCSPPGKDGKLHPAILFAARTVGVTRIFKAGRVQAIAAMAYGTETVPRVYKIFGPGNQYVTKAKQLILEEGVAIDMPAGPSEVLVLADESANPAFIAADLLSQAEHGEDSQVILVLNNSKLVAAIQQEISKQLQALPRKAIAEKALLNSRVVILPRQEAIDFVNAYAPEHLIINTVDPEGVAADIVNAGSVFLGNYSPEAIGDYASGTNHTLPTNGHAKAFAGVALESFVKYITYQQLTQEGIRNLGPVVEKMAEAEQLTAHKMAVTIRLATLTAKEDSRFKTQD